MMEIALRLAKRGRTVFSTDFGRFVENPARKENGGPHALKSASTCKNRRKETVKP